MKKIKVVVLMGGRSPEHEVSVISGANVVQNLDTKKYVVLPVVISKNGSKWSLTSEKALLSLKEPLSTRGTDRDLTLSNEITIGGISSISEKKVDVVFIAMHGPYGEDGTVQGMLELAGITYTGSKVLASAIGMDKITFRKLMKSEGIKNPAYVVVKKMNGVSSLAKHLGKPPYFVKPSGQGSSVGASVVRRKKDLGRALKAAFKFGESALVDEYLKGKEITCSVIGNDRPRALPVIEIRPLKGEFFDYDSKYTESGAEEIVPAKISKKLTDQVQKIAVKVYRVVGCRGFARVDFILKNNRTPVVLEINTIPGLTPMSLLPKAAKAAGISYKQLIDKIVKYALEA